MTQIPEDLVPEPGNFPPAPRTAMNILFALSFCHMLNDVIQSLLPSMYPILKQSFHLSFSEIGLITLTYQLTASLLQPLVGFYTDRRLTPYSLSIGMTFTLVGLLLLARASSLEALLIAAGLTGAGSSVFHPEASRVAHMAAGGRHGFAQSLFQVGGNFGTSLGPLLAASIIVSRGQSSIAWFAILALLGIVLLARIGRWYARNRLSLRPRPRPRHGANAPLPRSTVALSLIILVILIIFKYFYLISLVNYYTFYLIHKFGVSVRTSQIDLFIFLLAVAAGTILGGPLGDRFGRKIVIWVSILGVAPFTLILPHVGLTACVLLTIVIGAVLASAFSAILVFAQELLPGNVGMVAGLFFGFAFGVSGISSAALGRLADHSGIEFVFHVCGYLPLLGLLAAFLPNLKHPRESRS